MEDADRVRGATAGDLFERSHIAAPVISAQPLRAGLFAGAARYAGGILLAAFAVAYLIWLPLRPVGTPMTDFSAYYSAGRYWSHGGDPYGTGVWSVEKTLPGVDPTRHELLPYVGPPLSLPLWAALGMLPYVVAAPIWGLVVVGSAALVVIIPARIAQRRIRGGASTSLLLLALTAGPLVTGISVGQAALPAAAAVDLAIVFAARRRWWLMAVATVVAVTLKPNDALVIAGAVKELAALCAVGLSVIASALANLPFAGGIHGALEYASVLAHQSDAERFFTYQMTPTSVAYGFGMQAESAVLLGTSISIAAIGIIVSAIRLVRADVIDSAAIACALLPFVLPFEHEPDLTIVFFPALLVAFRARGRTWALGAAGTVLLCVDPFALAQGRLGLVFTIVTVGVACLQLAALAPLGLRWIRLWPFAIVPLILIAGIFAPPTRLPLWPDTLPQHVAVTPTASANAQWHDELVASGLEKQRPWASLVRLFTLFGCAFVGIAMVRTAAASARAAKPRRLALPAMSIPIRPHPIPTQHQE